MVYEIEFFRVKVIFAIYLFGEYGRIIFDSVSVVDDNKVFFCRYPYFLSTSCGKH